MSLAGNAALKLRLHFFSAAAFQRIGASAHQQRPGNAEQYRQPFHLSILESKPPIAIAKERLDRINKIDGMNFGLCPLISDSYPVHSANPVISTYEQ